MSGPDNITVEQDVSIAPPVRGSMIIDAVIRLVDQDTTSSLHIKSKRNRILVGKWGAERINVRPTGSHDDGFVPEELYSKIVVAGVEFFGRAANGTEPNAGEDISKKVANFAAALTKELDKR